MPKTWNPDDLEEYPVYHPGDSQVDALFQTPKATRNRDKEFTEGPIEVEEDWWSTNPVQLALKDTLSRLGDTPALRETVDSLGRTHGNGVTGDFYGLRHVSGFPMIPSTYPVADNRITRAKAGLSNEFVADWHKTVLRAFVRLMFSNLEPVPLTLRKNSSSMIPYYTSRMAEKIEYVKFALDAAPRSMRAAAQGDFETAWNQYTLGGAYHTVYRRQNTDKITKEKDGTWKAKDRPVANLAYAVSGGRRGTYTPASKSLEGALDKGKPFKYPDGFFRERNRTAMGCPLGTNALLMPIAQAVRKALYERYPYTYHHTTRESIQEDVRKMAMVIPSDVSLHDQYWPVDLVIPVICQELEEMGFHPDWVHGVYKLKAYLPTYVTDVGPGLKNLLIGDPVNPCTRVGLHSGNAFTDLEGSLVMTWVYFLIQVEHTYRDIIPDLRDDQSALRLCDAYLMGKLPIVLKDKSDDALLGWTDPSFVGRAKMLHEKMAADEIVSPYMLVGYEHGGAFLGSVLLYPEDNNPQGILLIGNIRSLLPNRLAPEYGVQSRIKDRSGLKRPYPGLAWSTLDQNYGSSPGYSYVMEALERSYYDLTGESYAYKQQRRLERDQIALRNALRQASLGLPDLTPIEVAVLQDPSKLEYRYSRSDVRDEVLELLFSGLSVAEVSPFFHYVTQR